MMISWVRSFLSFKKFKMLAEKEKEEKIKCCRKNGEDEYSCDDFQIF